MNNDISVTVRFKKADEEFDVDFFTSLEKVEKEENWYQEHRERVVQPGEVTKRFITNEAISRIRQLDEIHNESPGVKFDKSVGVLCDVLSSLEMHEVISTFRSVNGPIMGLDRVAPITRTQKEYEEVIAKKRSDHFVNRLLTIAKKHPEPEVVRNEMTAAILALLADLKYYDVVSTFRSIKHNGFSDPLDE